MMNRPMMPAERRPTMTAEMSLLVDIGSAWTKASVVARSRGRWRICAHTAQPSAWEHGELVNALVAQLAAGVDRRLVDRLPHIVGSAPWIECHTPRRPGQLAIAAVSQDVSGAALRRAAQSAGWVVAESASMDDGRSLAERLAVLQAARVDAWLLAGGFDAGRAEQALEVAAMVAAARGEAPTPVIWAGSAQMTDEVVALFGADAVSVVANPRPAADRDEPGPLREHLEVLLQQIVDTGESIHLAPVSFRRAIAELARSSSVRIIGVDVGARYATWVTAEPDGAAMSRIFASGGLTSPSLVATGGPGRLARSMPYAIDELAVADVLQNVRARPATMPQTEDELAVTHAAVRSLLAQMAAEEATTGADLIVGSGRSLGTTPIPAQAAQLLLDGIRPLGVTQLAIDPSGALGPLGSLDDLEIGEGIASLRDDLIVPLGAAVVCRGGRSGQTAMRVTVHRVGWPAVGPIEVRSGSVQVLPLERGQQAELEIELEAGVTLGAARRSRRIRSEVRGGIVGLILDARDAPLLLPRRTDERRAVLAGWREAFLREPPPLSVRAE
jgi:hypothetical protein